MSEARIVHSFEKNSRETIVASLKMYNGYRLADLRIYVENDEGEEVPTKKGLCVKVEDLPGLLEGVQALVEASEERVAA
jgi:hypothetical protein